MNAGTAERGIPRYRETQALSVIHLRQSGRDVTQGERILMALAALAPVSRNGLDDFFNAERTTFPKSSITRCVAELMEAGLVKCVGLTVDPITHEEVELLDCGLDTRVRVKRANASRFESPQAAFDRGYKKGYRDSQGDNIPLGIAVGAVVVCLLWFILAA